MKLYELREKSRSLPLFPGVYIMKDAKGVIIYVGKAKNLKNRVSQYFRNVDKHSPKVYKMVENIDSYEYIVTDNEFEALVLECSLIKLHKPKYNILLKDDKGYSYVEVTNEEWPRIRAVLQKKDNDSIYIGPYTSSYSVKQTVDEANKVFCLPTCGRKFPGDFRKGRPCLNFHIKACMGVCRGNIDRADYRETVNEAVEFVKGGNIMSLKELERRMDEASQNLQFEKAAKIRDRIKAIKRLSENQKVVTSKTENQDVIAIARSSEAMCVQVFIFRRGKLSDKQEFIFTQLQEPDELRREFILAFYTGPENIPDQISIDGEIEDKALVVEYLCRLRGKSVKIVTPKQGERYKLIEMTRNNAAEKLSQFTDRSARELSAADELAKLLGLTKPPRYIEAYDISNISGNHTVAGMVVFEDGRPKKSAYKKFSIKTVVGQDDYAAMAEAIERRFEHYLYKDEQDEGFKRMPDLILLDGGKGHVSKIQSVLEKMRIDAVVFGMIKDDKHKTRAIAKNGGEISILSSRNAFSLISAIQEEVHRFAIGYQRTKHKTKSFESVLTSVEGIGEVRARNLTKHFRTLKAIKNAGISELASAPGMNVKAAKKLYEFFSENK